MEAFYAIERPEVSTDQLSAALSRLFFPGWMAGVTTFKTPWQVEVPLGFASFYAITDGGCQLSLSDAAQPMQLKAGDHVLLTRGREHRLIGQGANSTTTMGKNLMKLPEPPARQLVTTAIHGHFHASSSGLHLFNGVLPEVVRFNRNDVQILEDVEPVVRLIVKEQISAEKGWQTVVARLVKILFIQALRAFVMHGEGHHPDKSSLAAWLFAMSDGPIGPALGLIHGEPEKPWTVTSLAKRTRMSKSVFSERFRQLVGKPPSQYLTEYRMQRACELLVGTDLSVKEIGTRVGYESSSSFINAFRRLTGKTPVAFRKNGFSAPASARVAVI